jgi:hypothetical protein
MGKSNDGSRLQWDSGMVASLRRPCLDQRQGEGSGGVQRTFLLGRKWRGEKIIVAVISG